MLRQLVDNPRLAEENLLADEQKANIQTAMIALSRKPGKLDTGLIGRGLEGFQNRAAVELQSSGVTELDAVLGGGFPRGSLVELCGPASSGPTSLAVSLPALATELQEAGAFVDVSDSLDPFSLAAAG